MTATLLVIFCVTFPFALVRFSGWATPVLSALFAYAFGGLYVNACRLRNPFNYDGGSTGIPINAFIQRLERSTEAVLLGSSKQIGQELAAAGSFTVMNVQNSSLKKENEDLKNELKQLRERHGERLDALHEKQAKIRKMEEEMASNRTMLRQEWDRGFAWLQEC